MYSLPENQKSRIYLLLARGASHALIALIGLIGIAAFVYPFFLPVVNTGMATPPGRDTLFLFTLVFVLSLVVLFAEMESEGMNTKMVAALGVLTAINATLRLADTLLVVTNTIGGFSPVYLLVILCGYAYGSRFGFLLGALTMVVSALITGGVGPWLPYQMFVVGWMGLTAGWLPQRWLRGKRDERARRTLNRETVALTVFGFVWGFLVGALLNLYSWPLSVGGALNWSPGMTPLEIVQRYALFYAATSLWWDAVGAVSTAAMLLFLGTPILKVLRRFQRRFFFVTVTMETKTATV